MSLPKRNGPRRVLLELFVFTLGISLYTLQLGQESLWIDEILSIQSAQGRLDLNRPLYFILLRLWMLFSQNETWLRTLSVLFGLCCIGLTYCLGRRLVNRSVGLISGLLLALSPLAINHAQEVRYYMMSTCLGLAGSLCLSYALQRSKLPSLSGWLVCRCLGFLTVQPNGLLLVPDMMLIGWQYFSNRKHHHKHRLFSLGHWRWAIGLFIIPMAIILKDVIPPLIEFLRTQRWYAGTALRPSITNLVGLLATLTAWPLQGPIGQGLPWRGLTVFYTYFFNFYAVLTLGLLILPWVAKRLNLSHNAAKPTLLWLALWGLVPIGLVFALSQIFPFLWLERYSVIAIPYILILLAAGWQILWTRKKQLGILVAAVYFVAVSGPLMRYYTSDYHANWQGLATELARDEQLDDTALVYPGSFLPYINHYYTGNLALVSLEDTESPQQINSDQLVTQIQSLALPNGRFWLVCPIQGKWQEVSDNVIEQLVAQGFSPQKKTLFVNHWNWGPTLYLFSQAPLASINS